MKINFEQVINSMSLEQKVGQLFLLAYPGKDPQLIEPLVQRFGICGCYISQDNAETIAEASRISETLQNLGAPLPLLLGVDQEGAWALLQPETHTGPGNLALGALRNSSLIEDIYALYGSEMLAVGYNALLSPCADTNSNPNSPIIGTRSFGEDYDRVADCVAAAVRGARRTGVITTLKHFPGHGATEGDTHREIPYIDKGIEELLASDLKPFIAGIREGAEIIMTSHISYPQIDSQYPATLSPIILQDLLRTKIGFEGVILSDSMNMGAIRKNYDPAQSTLLALKAGVDIVMLSEEHYDHSPNYLEKQIASLELVCKAVRNGDLSSSFIDEKLRRILRLKQAMLVKKELSTPWENYQKLEEQVCYEAITLIRDHWKLLPFELGAGSVACINATPRTSYSNIMNPRGIGPNQAKPAFDSFWEEFSAPSPQCSASLEKFEHEQTHAQFNALENFAKIIIVTEDYPLPGEDMDKVEQQKLVNKVLARYGKKTLVLGLRSPYELENYPAEISYLCTFSSRSTSAKQAARMLKDARPALGQNHISIKHIA